MSSAPPPIPGPPVPPAAISPPAPPPRPPARINLLDTAEMQGWIARLQSQRRRLGWWNLGLKFALAAGVLAVAGVAWAVYHKTVGAYAVLENLVVRPHPANQGQLEISFDVVTPGKVCYRRGSGEIQAERVDYFAAPGAVRRSWTWAYEPGKEIEAVVRSRAKLLRQTQSVRFTTTRQADIVVLVDTTPSMNASLAELAGKWPAFCGQLAGQGFQPRFALVAFGDTAEGDWLEKRDFTADATEFCGWVRGVKRLEGSDLPESALDAVEEGLKLSFRPEAMRQFYLLSDAPYREPTVGGRTAADLARKLLQQRVMVHVFSRAEYESSYARLLGDWGKFHVIDDFGTALVQGRLLED